MKPWVVVDIETSGLDPAVHEVIEVGGVDNTGWEFEFSLPFDQSKAEEKALEVNGWGKRPFAPEISHANAVATLSGIFSHPNPLIVASPAHFDVGFLEALFRSQGSRPPWSHRSVIDLKSYACARLGVLTDFKNSEIARLFDIERDEDEDEHTALGDARWTARIWHALLGCES